MLSDFGNVSDVANHSTQSTSEMTSSVTSPSLRLVHVPSYYVYHVTTSQQVSPWANESSFAATLNATDAAYTTIQMAVLGILAGTTSLVTIAGNLVVILSFILERSIRQPTNYFIASLAVSDLLIGSVSMPFYTVYLLAGQYWPLGEKLCDLWLSIDYTVCLCSIYTVFCITVDRFCSVIVPAKYRNWRTERKVLVIIGLTWTIPVLVFFTSIFGWQYFVGVRTVEQGKCYVQYMESAVFNAVLQVGYFWITLVVMCCLYSGIYRVALRLQRKSEQKHRRTTTLVSVAGEAMTKIGIGMSKQQTPGAQTDRGIYARGETDEGMHPVGPGCVEDGYQTTTESVSGRRQNGQEDPEERSSSPAFSSDSDGSHSPKFSRPSKTDTRDRVQKTPNADAILPPYPGPNGAATKNASIASDRRNVLSLQPLTSSLHPDLLQFGEKMQRISRLDEEIGGTLSSVFLEPSAARYEGTRQNDLDTNSNQSTDNIWLLRTRSNDADESNRESSSIQSSPVWIRRSFHQRPDSVTHWSVTEERDQSSDTLNPRPKRRPPSPNATNRNHLQLTEKPRRQSNSFTLDCLSKKAAASKYASVSAQDEVTVTSGVGRLKTEVGEQREAEEEGQSRERGGENIRRQVNFSATLRWFESLRKRFASRTDSSSSTEGRSCPSGDASFHCPAASAAAAAAAAEGGGRACVKAKTSKSEDRAMKALRTITIILGAFVLCWTPWHVLSMTIGFCPSCVWPVLYDISYWLCYLNSPINPFCYAFANLQFKRTFLRIFKLDWHRT